MRWTWWWSLIKTLFNAMKPDRKGCSCCRLLARQVSPAPCWTRPSYLTMINKVRTLCVLFIWYWDHPHLLCCLKSCSWLGSSCTASQSSSSGLRRSRTSPRCSTHTSRLSRAHCDKFSSAGPGQYFSFLFVCLSMHHPSSSVSPISPFFPFYLFLSSLSCLCPFYLFPSSKLSLCPRFFSADFASRVFPSWTFEASFSPLVFPACLSCFPGEWWVVM